QAHPFFDTLLYHKYPKLRTINTKKKQVFTPAFSSIHPKFRKNPKF
ncbi:MAG: hypothetical protein ACI8WT_003758, partial [Clostridium sp.]